MNLSAIQAALRDSHNDCWLFYDHHHRDPIAYHLLGLPEKMMVTPLVLRSSRRRRTGEAGPPHREPSPRLAAWQEAGIFGVAGVVAEPGSDAQAVSLCGDAVFAQQPNPLHL